MVFEYFKEVHYYKNMKRYILLFGLFFSCREDVEVKLVPELVPELAVDFEIQQELYAISILNKVQNAVKYDLDYGDGTKITDQLAEPTNYLGVQGGSSYSYQKDGTYTIILTAYDKKGNSKTAKKQLVIDYFGKNTPKANFSLKLSDNGVVQIANLSENYSSLDIGVHVGNMGYNTKEENPIFEFDMNGKYQIKLAVEKNGHLSNSKTEVIEIKNITERELGYFKGEWFGKQINIQEDFNNQGITTYYDLGGGLNLYFLKNIFNIDDNNSIELINFKVKTDSLKTNQMKYEQIKSKYKLGIQNSADWSISNYFPLISSQNKTIEILEIREVSQRKIVPEMMDKAFWITYKIKADFGEKGKIDGTLKTRYLIY
jgi:PKD repeat protein